MLSSLVARYHADGDKCSVTTTPQLLAKVIRLFSYVQIHQEIGVDFSDIAIGFLRWFLPTGLYVSHKSLPLNPCHSRKEQPGPQLTMSMNTVFDPRQQPDSLRSMCDHLHSFGRTKGMSHAVSTKGYSFV